MKNNNINLNELLKVNRCALRSLHDTLGFDFNAPYHVYKIDGKFTVRKIEKMIQADKYTFKNAMVAVVTRRFDNYWRKDFCLVTVDNSGVNIDYKQCYYYSYVNSGLDILCSYVNSGLDILYRKSDFEEYRKNDNTETYVFCQLKVNLAEQKTKQVNYSERFKYVPYKYGKCCDGKGNSWYSNIKLQLTEEKGTVVDYKVSNHCYGLKTENLEDIIDKSGYIVCEHRRDWQYKARKLREKRVKAAFKATDNTVKINQLEKMIDQRKNELAEAFKNAVTAKEIQNVGKAIGGYFNSLYDIVDGFERLKAKDANKEYSSIEVFNNAYNGILEKMKKNKEMIGK